MWPVLRCALGQTNDWLNNGRPGGGAGLATRIALACTDEGLAAFEDLYGTPQLALLRRGAAGVGFGSR